MDRKRRVSPSNEWIAFFRGNVEEAVPIPWHAGAEITDHERYAITASMQAFQLGESSEGRHLVDRARAWGSQNDDPAYLEAIRLFIAEEARHARDLGRFMDLNGIPRIQKTFADTAFRSLRRSAGLELSIAVLVTAEVIAQVYYAALREATDSAVLRTLCDRILRDEAEHVRFQSERLALLACGRPRPLIVLRRLGQQTLMLATLLLVWPGHRLAFRAGGYSFARFVADTWTALTAALDLMDPRTYDWTTDALSATAPARR
jgi:hypothetical protein